MPLGLVPLHHFLDVQAGDALLQLLERVTQHVRTLVGVEVSSLKFIPVHQSNQPFANAVATSRGWLQGMCKFFAAHSIRLFTRPSLMPNSSPISLAR